jgi:methyl-accepting chemotaxis protein
MFNFVDSNKSDNGAITDALNRSQAVIEFTPQGHILTANDNFLRVVGYSLAEIKGKHHKMFVDNSEASSKEYQSFWASLAEGNFRQGEFKRVTKRGESVWLQATYNPILDKNGHVVKVVKFASDITKDKLLAADMEGQIKAISKSQAVIEFDTSGVILFANENFLGAVGYTLDEIKGKHHSMFLTAEDAQTADYKAFWRDLAQGKYHLGRYRRVGKGGGRSGLRLRITQY